MSEILDPRVPVRIRHETRLRLLTVTAVTDVTPKMRRISLQGDLEGFVSPSYCDHIKVFIFPAGIEPYVAPIGERGPEFPPEHKPQMRDYTPRFWDAVAGTLELDFVLHGDGPASGWAAQAKIGQTLVIGGPRGSFMVPTDFDWYLLAGDETALPAMGRRIESCPPAPRSWPSSMWRTPAKNRPLPRGLISASPICTAMACRQGPIASSLTPSRPRRCRRAWAMPISWGKPDEQVRARAFDRGARI